MSRVLNALAVGVVVAGLVLAGCAKDNNENKKKTNGEGEKETPKKPANGDT